MVRSAVVLHDLVSVVVDGIAYQKHHPSEAAEFIGLIIDQPAMIKKHSCIDFFKNGVEYYFVCLQVMYM